MLTVWFKFEDVAYANTSALNISGRERETALCPLLEHPRENRFDGAPFKELTIGVGDPAARTSTRVAFAR